MFIKYRNSQIHLKMYGKGYPVVLLHGFLLSPTIWEGLIPVLAKKNQVVVIDLPGHGKSECVAEIHTMELLAEVVNSVLEKLNIEKANFIGHSMGGYTSLAFAEKYPSKIETLVLLNSSSDSDSLERRTNRDRAIKVIQTHKEVFIKMAIALLFPENQQEKHQHLIDKFSEEAFQFPTKGIIASIKGMKIRKNRTSTLKNFKGKKYMICGFDDPIIPFSSSEKIALETNTTLYKVNSGHMSVNENIDEIVKIAHFIEYL